MISRARQGRENEELEQIDRELTLDDPDITLDRGGRIAREPQNVAGISQHTHTVPFLQHRAVLGNLVLAFPRPFQRIRINPLQTDKNPSDPFPAGLPDKTPNLLPHTTPPGAQP